MLNYTIYIYISAVIILSALSCTVSSVESDTQEEFETCTDDGWLVPCQQIVNATGKDGIPSIDEPKFTRASEVSFLENWELVHGIKIGDELKAYPNVILYYHEIVNDIVKNTPVAVTYCPLTGSGIAWDRKIDGQTTRFGVSGLIHKNNLIAYDQLTNSRWSQMKNKSIFGDLKGTNAKSIQIIEMKWGAWKEAFPDSRVLNTNTGYNRNYDKYLYGDDYPENNSRILFPVYNEDQRLEKKTLVHSVIRDLQAKAYPISDFDNSLQIINDEFEGLKLVIAGSSGMNMAVSFNRVLEDGTVLSFKTVKNKFPIIMEDQEGTQWNIFGEAIHGPRKGEKLNPISSYNAYWFALADFYSFPLIFNNF